MQDRWAPGPLFIGERRPGRGTTHEDPLVERIEGVIGLTIADMVYELVRVAMVQGADRRPDHGRADGPRADDG